jgi:hypothetical protein
MTTFTDYIIQVEYKKNGKAVIDKCLAFATSTRDAMWKVSQDYKERGITFDNIKVIKE